MKYFLTLLSICCIILLSCKKDECEIECITSFDNLGFNRTDVDSLLSSCIIDRIEEKRTTSRPIKEILAQNIQGETHFLLNTYAVAQDGIDIIVNKNCDTMSVIGGQCILECRCECENRKIQYDNDKWVSIWQQNEN